MRIIHHREKPVGNTDDIERRRQRELNISVTGPLAESSSAA